MHQNLYQKYRPQTFAEIIGQNHITKTMAGALKSEKIAHAYLFCGSRGTGKTSTARILAKAINCTKREEHEEQGTKKNGKSTQISGLSSQFSIEPCGTCENCIEITRGSSLDVMEVDAASTRGIDDIRELRENIKFSPVKTKFKVFIIDEVHMLTKEAFNALLKTLEEPPEYAVFILATTEAHKLPETIVSRCQNFDFKRISIADMVLHLEKIAKNEKLKISKKALEKIALRASGSSRDSLSLLNQLASANNDISDEFVDEILGFVDMREVYKFVDFLIEENTQELVNLINHLSENGVDLEEFNKQLVSYFRDLLVTKSAGSSVLDVTKEMEETINAQSKKIEKNVLIQVINILLDAKENFKLSPIKQLPLELAVSKILGADFSDYPADNAYKIDSPSSANDSKPLSKNVIITENEQSESIKLEKSTVKESESKLIISKEKKIKKKSNLPHSESIKDLLKNWPKIVDEFKQYNHSLRAFMVASTPTSLENNKLTLTFKYPFHAQQAGATKNKQIIEKVFSENLGKSIVVSMEVGEVTLAKKSENSAFDAAKQVFGEDEAP